MEVIGRVPCVSSIEVFVTRMKSNLQAVNYLYGIHVWFLQVSNWLTTEIVFTENLEERVALVSRLVDVVVVSRRRERGGRGRLGEGDGGVRKREPVLSCQLFDHRLL